MNFVSGDMAAKLGGQTIGIRPEHMQVSATDGLWSGQLRHIERLGGETLLYVDVAGIGQMTVKADGDARYAAGQHMHLSPREGCVHVF